MPLRNAGSVLEQVVVTEVVRVVSAHLGAQRALEFVNAFAMPALSEWAPHGVALNALAHGRLVEIGAWPRHGTAFNALFATCVSADPTLGPSCSLLVAMLARRQGRAIRMWLNDTGERYGAGTSLGPVGLSAVLARLDPIPSPPTNQTVHCSTPYPESIADLTEKLLAWSEPEVCRVGFLDPDRYMTTPRVAACTSSRDLREWLRALRAGTPDLSVSVHFTANSHHTTRAAEFASMDADALAEGYCPLLDARHDYHRVSVVATKHEALDSIRSELAAAVRTAVDAFRGRNSLALTLI